MTTGPLNRRSAASAAVLAPAVAGLTSFALYLRTLLPGIAFGDWGEMQTVPHVLGVAHPTGYPTYILLAWLAELVPIGSVAYRANLLSAVLVAAAVAVAVVILQRLGSRPVIALAAGFALGSVGTVWAAATVAEVNPLHFLFVALILHRAIVWQERRATRDLVIGALLLGLAAGNHLLILFVAPFVAAFVIWTGRRELMDRPSLLVPAIVAGLIGLSVYLYIPIAASLDPPLAYNHPTSLDGVAWLVSGAQFRGQFGFFSSRVVADTLAALPGLWDVLVVEGSAALPILGVAGIAVLVRRRPAFGVAVAAILVMNVVIWANYLRLEHYLLATWLLLALGGGVVLESIARRIDGWSRAGLGRPVGWLVGVGAVVLAAGLAGSNWATADRSADRSGDAYVDRLFEALPERAAILTEWDASTPLWHAQFVLGRRPDVLVVDDTNIVYEGWVTREQRIEALICDRPVFTLRLADPDLDPTRDSFRLEPFLTVRISLGGPSAAVEREVWRVVPRDPSRCGASAALAARNGPAAG